MCSLKEPAQKLQIERAVMQAAEQRRDERALWNSAALQVVAAIDVYHVGEHVLAEQSEHPSQRNA